MKMLHSIHCNKCLVPLHESNNNIFVMECGHTVCRTCLEKNGKAKMCVVCRKNVSYMNLGGQMDESIREFFTPLEEVLQRTIAKATNRIIEVSRFQQQYMQRYLQNMATRLNYTRKKYSELYAAHGKVVEQNQQLKAQLRSRSSRSGGVHLPASTPISMAMTHGGFTKSNNTPISTIMNTPRYPGMPPSTVSHRRLEGLHLGSGSSTGYQASVAATSRSGTALSINELRRQRAVTPSAGRKEMSDVYKGHVRYGSSVPHVN